MVIFLKYVPLTEAGFAFISVSKIVLTFSSKAFSSKPIINSPTRPPTPSTTAFVASVVDNVFDAVQQLSMVSPNDQRTCKFGCC